LFCLVCLTDEYYAVPNERQLLVSVKRLQHTNINKKKTFTLKNDAILCITYRIMNNC
jgi:hypothetical protein